MLYHCFLDSLQLTWAFVGFSLIFLGVFSLFYATRPLWVLGGRGLDLAS